MFLETSLIEQDMAFGKSIRSGMPSISKDMQIIQIVLEEAEAMSEMVRYWILKLSRVRSNPLSREVNQNPTMSPLK